MLRVREIMHDGVIGIRPEANLHDPPVVMTATPNTTIPELARSMAESHIHRALVTENGKLLGIVTTFDIMRAVAEPAAGEGGETEASPAEPQSNAELEPGFW